MKEEVKMFKDYCYDGSKRFRISKVKTDDTSLCKVREEAEAKLLKNNKKIDALSQKLYAEKKEGVIFLFQAMDAAGKDGTIRAVLQCLSPHGVYEAAFKAPSADDLNHDYLLRVHLMAPGKGEIAIFNRSHYEDVLIGKVRKLYESQTHADRIDVDTIIEKRYQDINNFEEYLWNNNVRVVKIFLNVSKDEQARRFLSRIEEPEKNWKFSEADWNERKYWDEYQQAFEDAINATSTEHCPWFVVPADHKWYMRYVVSEIILATLKEMDPHYPTVTKERLETFQALKEEIESELPKQVRTMKSIPVASEEKTKKGKTEKKEKKTKKEKPADDKKDKKTKKDKKDTKDKKSGKQP